MRYWWILLLILAGMMARMVLQQNTTKPSGLIGKTAPVFNQPVVPGTSAQWGKQLSSSRFAGKPLLVNIWASWCPPCLQEAPVLQAAYANKRIQIVGIAVKDKPQDAAKFVKDFGLTFPSVLDPQGRLQIEFGAYGQPESFLIDAKGVVVARHTGPLNASSLEELLAKVNP